MIPADSFTVAVEIQCESVVYKPNKCIRPIPYASFHNITWVEWSGRKAVGYGEYNGVPVKIVYTDYAFDGTNNLFTAMTWSFE